MESFLLHSGDGRYQGREVLG